MELTTQYLHIKHGSLHSSKLRLFIIPLFFMATSSSALQLNRHNRDIHPDLDPALEFGDFPDATPLSHTIMVHEALATSTRATELLLPLAMVYIPRERTVRIKEWRGRSGNNLRQLMSAIIFAEVNGIDSVLLPSRKGAIGSVLDLPQAIPIDVNPTLNATCHTTPHPLEDTFLMPICRVTLEDNRRAMLKYVKPLLSQRVVDACAEEKSDASVVTVHMRSGDLLGRAEGQGKCAPCSYLNVIVNMHKYDHIRIVTEPDLKHPCLHYSYNVTSVQIQSSSMEKDICAIMTASNLVHFSSSTFAKYFGWVLNENLHRVYWPFPSSPEVGTDESCPNQILDAVTRTTFLFIINATFPTSPLEKEYFLTHVPASAISLNYTQCH